MILPVEGGVVVLDLHLEGLVFPKFACRGAVGGAGHGILHGLHVPPEVGGFLLVANHAIEIGDGHILLRHGNLDFLLGRGSLAWDLEIAEPGNLVPPILGVGKIADADTMIHELADKHLKVCGERRPFSDRAGKLLGKNSVVLVTLCVLPELRLHGHEMFHGEDNVVIPLRHLCHDLCTLQEVCVRQRRLLLCAAGCWVVWRVAIKHPLHTDAHGRAAFVVLDHPVVVRPNDCRRHGAVLGCLTLVVEEGEV